MQDISQYKQQKEEYLDGSENKENIKFNTCGGELNYLTNIKTCNNFEKNEAKYFKENFEMIINFFFKSNKILLFSISMITLIFVVYMQDIINLIINSSVLISGLLIIVLFFRLILNESNIKNPIIKLFIDNSVFFIIPLFIIFSRIVIFKAINI